MKLFNFFKRKEQSIDEFFGNEIKAKSINANEALKISAVYACVNLLSQSISTLPFALYEKTDKGAQKATKHPLYKLLSIAPNESMNAQTFFSMLVINTLLRGNGFVRANRARSGAILSLEVLESEKVSIDLNAKKFYYRDINTYEYEFSELVNVIFSPSTNGIVGLTPIAQCQSSLLLSGSLDESGTAFFDNRANPSGVLSFEANMSDEQYKRIKNAINKNHKGKNSGGVMVLEGGAKFQALSLNNSDAQFLELKNFQVADIARIFRVPPHLIGDLSRATFDNAEQLKITFVDSTIRPLCEMIEKAFNHRLLSADEQEKYYFKFNLAGLLRGDMKSRFEAYNIGRNIGVYSANDIRKLEDLNDIENGDIYLQALNMDEAGNSENSKQKSYIPKSRLRSKNG